MKWTPQMVDRLHALAVENWSAAQIGRELGVSRNSVISKSRREEIHLNGSSGRKLRRLTDKQAEAVRHSKLSDSQIAAYCQVSASTIRNIRIGYTYKDVGGPRA